jgi:hypothetical protein
VDSGPNLVHEALQCELAGDNGKRESLLLEALKTPGNSAAHWQLGEIWDAENTSWLTPSQIEQAALQDRHLTEYRKRRKAFEPTIDEQIKLSYWCKNNKLENEARAHSFLAEQLKPVTLAALAGLDPEFDRKMLLATGQIPQNQYRAQPDPQANFQRAAAAELKKAIAAGESSPSDELREQMRDISDAGELRGMQKMAWQQAGRIEETQLAAALLFAKSLRDNPHPAAAECLARLAVAADWKNVRKACAAGLKEHPLDHYAPLLLQSLRSPISADIRFDVDVIGNLITQKNFHREGPRADISASETITPNSLLPEWRYPTRSLPEPILAGPRNIASSSMANKANPQANSLRQRNELARQSQAISQANLTQAYEDEALRRNTYMNSRATATREAKTFYDQAEKANRGIVENNARIVDVLQQATGKDFDKPAEWWNWWQEYNDTYNPLSSAGSSSSEPYPYDPTPAKPLLKYESVQQYQGRTLPQPYWMHSCFSPSTKVWTQLGKVAIEKLEIGDRVLSQNVETGELAYKPVLMVTIRPPHQRLKIVVGKELIVATPGHPFWVDGKAWLMVKELEAGQLLHSISGGVAIESIDRPEVTQTYEPNSYNLVVADFGTFFVGEQGLLVHDNIPRQPTSALIPGLPANAAPPRKSE